MASRNAIFAFGTICGRRPTNGRLETNCYRACAKWMQNRENSSFSSGDRSNQYGRNEKRRNFGIAIGSATAAAAIFSVRWYYDDIERFFKSKISLAAAKKKKVVW